MKKFLILALLALLIPSVMALPDLEDQLKGDAYIRNAGAPWLDDDAVLYFGRDKDGSLKFNSTSGYLEMVGLTAYDNTSITVESGEDITFAGGDSKIDLSAGSGLWKMPLGQGTIGGATDFNGAITCRDVTLDANKNVTMSGTGTYTTGTGAVTLAGDTSIGKTLSLSVNASTTVDTTLTSSSTKTVYGVDAHSANVTLTLPDAATVTGRTYTIATNVDPGNYYVKVTATGGDKLGGAGGATTLMTTTAAAGISLVSDGSLYLVNGAYGTWS